MRTCLSVCLTVCSAVKPQKHSLVHVEVWLGEGHKTVGARWQKRFVEIHDSYQFESKSYHSMQYHFRSIDTWLQGICRRWVEWSGWVVFAGVCGPCTPPTATALNMSGREGRHFSQAEGLCLPCLTVSQERRQRSCASRRGRGMGCVHKHGRKKTTQETQESGRRKVRLKGILCMQAGSDQGCYHLCVCGGGHVWCMYVCVSACVRLCHFPVQLQTVASLQLLWRVSCQVQF